MKKILIIPTYYYLANPLYTALYQLLKDDFKFIYFFSKDSTMIKGNLENITKEKVGYIFDEYVEITYETPWAKRAYRQTSVIPKSNNIKSLTIEHKPLYKKIILLLLKIIKFTLRPIKRFISKWKNILNILRDIKKYTTEFRTIIQSISPDIIIITSDMTMSYRIIKKYFPKIELIIMQPCFLDFRKKEKKRLSQLEKIRHFVSGKILYPQQQYFGMENNNDKLLLIEDRFLEFYKNKRDNIFRIINPYYYQLNKDIENFKVPKTRETLLRVLNLDISKDVIIIFLSDYTLIHGEAIQTYLEDTYIQLIKKYEYKYNFIIKNHPRAGVKDFEANFNDLSKIFFLKNELTYNELLSIGDLNISINSNASLEAIISGMPTINFLPLHLKGNEHYEWLTYYGGINIYTYAEMANFLNTFKKNKNTLIDNLNSNRLKLIGEDGECKKLLLDMLNKKQIP